MPLVRISLLRGKPEGFGRKVGDVVYQAMRDTLNVPVKDKFQVISEHAPDSLVYDADYLDIERSDGFIAIQITLSEGPQRRGEAGVLPARCRGSATQARRAAAGRLREPRRGEEGKLVVLQ